MFKKLPKWNEKFSYEFHWNDDDDGQQQKWVMNLDFLTASMSFRNEYDVCVVPDVWSDQVFVWFASVHAKHDQLSDALF